MFQEKAKHYKGRKQSKNLTILLTVDVCVCICILLAAWVVFLKEPQAAALVSESTSVEMALAPDIAPSEVEPNQTLIASSAEGESAGSGKADTSTSEPSADSTAKKSGGGVADISFAGEVSIFLESKMAKLRFGNGESSTVDVIVQIVVEEQILAQSKKITPGYEINQLALAEGATELLSAGSYEGWLRFYSYDQETGARTPVWSDIPITITVQT